MALATTDTPANRNSTSSHAWHALAADRALAVLGTTPKGLDQGEAISRQNRYGPNRLPEAVGQSPLRRFLAQFNNALIYFLLVAAIAAAALGHWIDASVIVAVVTVNAIVGYLQEGKAERALNAISRMIAHHAVVLRDGKRQRVEVETLVPGDIVLIEAGDRVPADLRLLRARSLLIDEAILTGESVASEKREDPVSVDAALGDRRSMAYSGTMVATGQGTGIVVATGTATEIGHISTLMHGVEQITTPLLRQINRFGQRFTLVAMVSAIVLFLFAVFVRGFPWTEALLAVVALAVSAVPEGLPAVITITLAIGVQRMAARNAVVRKLPAVETLGATSVICSDKTGTLTRNEMTARRIVTAGHDIQVSGSGYAPLGSFTVSGPDDDIASVAAAAWLLRAALLCNDAHLHQRDGNWIVDGDPMEGALVALAMKAGLDPDHARREWGRLDEIPFDAQTRYMATLNRGPHESVLFVKGAPERILDMCQLQRGQSADGEAQDKPIDRAYWQGRIAAAASDGERVLGFAVKRHAGTEERLTPDALKDGLVFIGIVGFIDPPRDEALTAIEECRGAGIQVKMITGDHADTASAIARQLGLEQPTAALTGHDLDRIPDDTLERVVAETSVFARTSPAHKLRIVRALQSKGAIVAMTGDGVNDAPSLKQADVGVAMGRKGTEAAKEAARMVLLDDNFASIVAAVREGRTVYDNIRKVIAWTMPTNGGEVVTVVVAIMLGFSMPMIAVHILWINLITSVTLGLVLAFEPAEPGVMQRRPRQPDAPLLSPFLVWRVFFVSALFALACLALFFNALWSGRDIETARTIVVNTIVVLEIFYLFNVRYLGMTSLTWRGTTGTPAVLIAIAIAIAVQLLFTYAPFMQALFQTRPLGPTDAIPIFAAGVALLAVLEIEKKLLRRFDVFRELA